MIGEFQIWLTGYSTFSPVAKRTGLLGHLALHLLGGLLGVPGDVGGAQEILQLQQLAGAGKRLLRCDVQGRAGDQGGGQGGVQVLLIDDTTTGGVDQIGAPLHFLEGGRSNKSRVQGWRGQ